MTVVNFCAFASD